MKQDVPFIGMTAVLNAVKRIAPSLDSLLLLGETGTGKELVARTIHGFSPRTTWPFVVVNGSALPETPNEHEPVGHERGSFCGINVGKVELATGGTVFLDEIEAMPPLQQSRVRNILQNNHSQHVGDTVSIPLDLRVLAATNRNIRKPRRGSS